MPPMEGAPEPGEVPREGRRKERLTAIYSAFLLSLRIYPNSSEVCILRFHIDCREFFRSFFNLQFNLLDNA
ncbi:hypothetical protein DM860_013187 [Cuscuta australis]|uniref:Uncharacterized protein n=1 Tax=Cuscuta australis TaxID=267555 RepID=A0A328DNH3_9ASTE|nr:hypothetical protein DM860_013187 [Cuscuta australis]